MNLVIWCHVINPEKAEFIIFTNKSKLTSGGTFYEINFSPGNNWGGCPLDVLTD